MNKIGWSASKFDTENPFGADNGATPLTSANFGADAENIPNAPPVWLQDAASSQTQAAAVARSSSGQAAATSAPGAPAAEMDA
jgi:hypothetical protein